MISPVTKVAVRRIKKQAGKSALFAGTILFLSALATFLLSFFADFSAADLANGAAFSVFSQKMQFYAGMATALLLAGTVLTVLDYSSMRRKECADVMAVLTSVGANKRQKRRLFWAELWILCYPPFLLGAFSGALIASLYTGESFSLFEALLVFFAGCLFATISYFLPSFSRRTVIQSVKKQNLNADRETHGYRQSRTFRSQSLLKRLADKSVDYYVDAYKRIASSLALAAFYPTLAFLLFQRIAKIDVFVDGGGDLVAFDKILVFLFVAFLILTLLGMVHVFLLVRAHLASRKETEKIYLSIGLTKREYRRIGMLEMRGIALRAIVYFVAWVLAANFLFEAV